MPENAKPSLLIVDDDPLITETLSYALGKDFEVMVSDSRAHAVSLLRQLDEAPQLALVDLGLPPPAAPARGGLPADQRPARALAGDEDPGALGPERRRQRAARAHARRRRVRRQALRPGRSQEGPDARAAVSRRGDLRR